MPKIWSSGVNNNDNFKINKNTPTTKKQKTRAEIKNTVLNAFSIFFYFNN